MDGESGGGATSRILTAMTTRAHRLVRRDELLELRQVQEDVLARSQLTQLGWTPAAIDAQIAGGRWRALGTHTLLAHTGPQSEQSRWWAAVFEVGPDATVAGVTALLAAGLRGVQESTVHVAVPKSTRWRPMTGVRVHETRRFDHRDVISAGLPRMRPAVAAVQAALWAKSNRQAALFLLAPVQQRLVTAASVSEALQRVRRDRRLALMRTVVADSLDGVHALGELDFARLCRQRGLPEPDRQVVEYASGGKAYLDVKWRRWGVGAEIDGAQHLEVSTWLAESWRNNAVVITGTRLLKIPLLALRLDADTFMDQVEDALRAGGWPGPTPAG